jgi:hypothetical protein
LLITLSTVLMKMMTNQHPITPPLELVHQWADMLASRSDQAVFTMAAQWGADEELEACCEWLREFHPGGTEQLRCSRRSKPPSLKEQALLQLDTLNADLAMHGRGCDLSQIRRALEALPN